MRERRDEMKVKVAIMDLFDWDPHSYSMLCFGQILVWEPHLNREETRKNNGFMWAKWTT